MDLKKWILHPVNSEKIAGPTMETIAEAVLDQSVEVANDSRLSLRYRLLGPAGLVLGEQLRIAKARFFHRPGGGRADA